MRPEAENLLAQAREDLLTAETLQVAVATTPPSSPSSPRKRP
ncbi:MULTISPECIES: hypothetical protein [Thermus]|nr:MULTISPECIES: hypothetical protein [Thermus]